MDTIYIRDLTARCIIGIYPVERRNKQEVILNIALRGDFRRAAKSDRIGDAINYKTIKNDVLKLVERSRFNLVERLAERVAAVCLRARGVKEVTVTLNKPGALRFARSVAVEITRPLPVSGSGARGA